MTHTPKQDVTKWHQLSGNPTLIRPPGIVKPIKIDSIKRAKFIVTACNHHEALKDALSILSGNSNCSCIAGGPLCPKCNADRVLNTLQLQEQVDE